MTVLRDYPYFGAGLLMLLLLMPMLLVAGPQRRMVLLAGAVAIPGVPFGLIFERIYWTPVRLFGWPFGVEDLLYLFGIGSRAWFFAVLLWIAQVRTTAEPETWVRRLAATTLAGAGLLLAGTAFGVPSGQVALLVPMPIAAFLLLRQPQLWRIALAGGVGCAVFGWLELLLQFALWPDFKQSWTRDAITSVSLFGVPAGDLWWSAAVGAAHPLVLAYASGAEIVDRRDLARS